MSLASTQMEPATQVDILIIGVGPAGATLASFLSRYGSLICGESLFIVDGVSRLWLSIVSAILQTVRVLISRISSAKLDTFNLNWGNSVNSMKFGVN
jgi:pyruvate/2-oxoglutarate dehydrogenase complex dihydrolipoamide dehydrogenase (E3) component